jgi:hypothetical protein
MSGEISRGSARHGNLRFSRPRYNFSDEQVVFQKLRWFLHLGAPCRGWYQFSNEISLVLCLEISERPHLSAASTLLGYPDQTAVRHLGCTRIHCTSTRFSGVSSLRPTGFTASSQEPSKNARTHPQCGIPVELNHLHHELGHRPKLLPFALIDGNAILTSTVRDPDLTQFDS